MSALPEYSKEKKLNGKYGNLVLRNFAPFESAKVQKLLSLTGEVCVFGYQRRKYIDLSREGNVKNVPFLSDGTKRV